MTILESLKSLNGYPISANSLTEIAENRGLVIDSEVTADIRGERGFMLAKADVLRWLSIAPNVSQSGVSYSFTAEERRQLKKQADDIYSDLGEDILIAVMGLVVLSCTEIKPELKFKLKVEAQINEPTTNVWVQSVNIVTNNFFGYFPENPEKDAKFEIAENSNEINSWVDRFVEKNIIDRLPNKTLYLIKVEGWVKESNTGIMIYVEKIFANHGNKDAPNNCMKLIE